MQHYFTEKHDLSTINSSFELASRGADRLIMEIFDVDGEQCLSYHMNGPNEADHYTFNLVFHDVIHINMPMDFQLSCGTSIAVRECEIIKPLLEPYFYEQMYEELFSSQNVGSYKPYCLIDDNGRFLNNFVISRCLTGKWITRK